MKTDKLVSTLGVALFASLAINIFMAGMVVGSSVGASHKVSSDTAVQQDQELRAGLSEADKLALKQAMDTNREKITSLHNDIEGMKNNIRDILKKEPMDNAALGIVLENKKNKELTLLQLVHKARETAMDVMSPEGQAILSKVSRLGFDLNAQCH